MAPKRKSKPAAAKHPFFTHRNGQPVFLQDIDHDQAAALPGATVLVPYIVNGKPRSLLLFKGLFHN
ncbi:hypothetical protein [Hymenobacter coalescens]